VKEPKIDDFIRIFYHNQVRTNTPTAADTRKNRRYAWGLGHQADRRYASLHLRETPQVAPYASGEDRGGFDLRIVRRQRLRGSGSATCKAGDRRSVEPDSRASVRGSHAAFRRRGPTSIVRPASAGRVGYATCTRPVARPPRTTLQLLQTTEDRGSASLIRSPATGGACLITDQVSRLGHRVGSGGLEPTVWLAPIEQRVRPFAPPREPVHRK